MGTNYYLEHVNGERQHLGKMSSRGAGKGQLFTWAVRPVDVMLLVLGGGSVHTRVSGGDAVVRLTEMVVELSRLSVEHDYSLIGQEFS